MRRISARLLAGTLVGCIAIAATPAAFAKKQAKEAAAVPEMSVAFRTAAIPVQNAIAAKNYAAANSGIAAAEGAAVTPYEKYVAAHFRLEIATNLNDTGNQYKAIEAILATGQSTGKELPAMYFHAGNFAYTDGKYDLASSRLAQAVELGYAQNNVQLMLADSYLKLNRLDEAFAIARQAIATKRAAGEQVPPDWFNRPASAAQKAGRSADLIDFIALRTESYPTPENWRNAAILTLQALKSEKGVTLDFYRLMDATGAIQSRNEYYEWAAAAGDSGLPGESVKAYQAGLRSGRVTASDAEFLALSKQQSSEIARDKAGLAGAESSAAAATTGTIARATGDAWLGYDEYAKAAAMYRLALQKGGIDTAQVTTRLGISLARSGDYAGAKQALSTVTGPMAGLARLWTIYVDQKMAMPAVAPAS